MLDERWSEEVEEIGETLRRLLSVESSVQRVREAEAASDGRDSRLEAALSQFGLDDLDPLQAGPELRARVAYELGRALASTPYVESMATSYVLGRRGVSFGFHGLVPASVPLVAVRSRDGVLIEPLNGDTQRSSAGDLLVQHTSSGAGEVVADSAAANRLARSAALFDSARLVGAGQALLERGCAYARERTQFGKAIGAYQGVAHRLVNAATGLDASELMVRKAAFTALPKAGGDGAPSKAFALMVWAKSVEAARLVATTVHQVFGGTGFAMECDVQLYSRRLRSWANRGARASTQLAELGRLVLDPQQRNTLRLLWQYDAGMPLPRWAREADSSAQPRK